MPITVMVVNASIGLDLLWNIGIFLVRMMCTINVWVKRDSTNHPV